MVLRTRHDVERRLHGADEAIHILVVGIHERCSLQGVTPHGGVGAINAVHRPEVYEARGEPQRHVVAHECVVVVGEPTARQRVDEVRVEGHVEPAAETLVEVRPNRLLPVARVLDDPGVLGGEA